MLHDACVVIVCSGHKRGYFGDQVIEYGAHQFMVASVPMPFEGETFASPEDVILKKMEYYKEGHSEKHIRDIVGVLKLRAEKLDRNYIEKWAVRLQLTDIWHAVVERTDNS